MNCPNFAHGCACLNYYVGELNDDIPLAYSAVRTRNGIGAADVPTTRSTFFKPLLGPGSTTIK
jgi:hypothetical protein